MNPEKDYSKTRRSLILLPLFLALGSLAFKSENAKATTARRLSRSALIPELSLSNESFSVFDKLLNPFISESNSRRIKWMQSFQDSEYSLRIEPELNTSRVNFLLYGEGITNEPKDKQGSDNLGRIGSHSIFSYDIQKRVLDIVSLTHDIRAPEIERFKRDRLKLENVKPTKIFHAFEIGKELKGSYEDGFNLQKQILERATGLSCDFQVVFPEMAMVKLIDQCFGKIRINIPQTFSIHPVFFEEYDKQGVNISQKIERRTYEQGVVELNGRESVGIIKAVAIEDKPEPALEHNVRKKWVVDGIINGLKENWVNPLFWKNFYDYVSDKPFKTDFDIPALLLSNIRSIAGLIKSPFDGTKMSLMPEIGRNIYIVDKKHGAGGVRWINMIEKTLGGYEDPHMAVPVGGDPNHPDLLNYYWGAPLGPRAVVRNLLLS